MNKQLNRATITVDKELRDELKELAARERITIKQLIEGWHRKYVREGRLLK